MKTDHRIDELRSFMNEEGIAAAVVMDPDNQFYLSNFKALMYSRPIIVLLEEHNVSLIVPALEEVHANEEAKVDKILVYYEHPEMAHKGTDPLHHVGGLLSYHAPGAKIGVDMAHTPASLVDYIQVLGFKVTDIGRKMVEMRYVKDSDELALMEEAGRLANLALSESLSACEAGITELEIDARGNVAVFAETAKRHPNATLDLSSCLLQVPIGRLCRMFSQIRANCKKAILSFTADKLL